MTVLYRLDRMQITKDQSECFANDATLATRISAYPDDATLIKSHLEEQKFKKQRDIFIRNFRKKRWNRLNMQTCTYDVDLTSWEVSVIKYCS